MTRKLTFEPDPRTVNDRHGLMITRGQIEHLGHTALKAQMLVDNSRNTIGFGSNDKFGTFGNPLTSDQKRRAQVSCWGTSFKMLFLEDIGASVRTSDWCDYIFDTMARQEMPEPTDLYAGSRHEARWYESHFASLQGEPTSRRGLFHVWENPKTGKRIHILDRNTAYPFSSSAVRTMIEQRDPSWRQFVPGKLWEFYEWEYPPHLRVALQGEAFPSPEDHPIGTLFVENSDPDTVWQLRADRKWRIHDANESKMKSLGD